MNKTPEVKVGTQKKLALQLADTAQIQLEFDLHVIGDH
jgi:hypothetical protein